MADELAGAEALAEAVAQTVGDGCVILRLGPNGDSHVVAAAHRDQRRAQELRALIGQSPRPSSGWESQAADRALALRLVGDDAARALELPGTPAGALMMVPLRAAGQTSGLVLALREGHRYPYTRRDQTVLERLVPGDRGGPRAPLDPSRLLDHVDSGVWVTDTEGSTIYVNDSLCRTLSVPASELAGRAMADFIDEVPELIRGRGSEDAERRDHRLRRADGRDVWVAASSVPLVDADGRRSGTVTTMTEITRRKQAEIELRMRLAAHETVAELSGWALSGEPVETLIHSVAAAVADLLDAERVAVAEATEAAGQVVPRAFVGWDPALLGSTIELPSGSAAAVAMDGGDLVLVGDLTADSTPFEPSLAVREAGMRSAVFIGIGDGLGVLAAHSTRPQAFADRDLGFLRSLADLLALRWQAQPPDLVTL